MATLGHTSVGATQQNLVNHFLLCFGPWQAPEDGDVTEVAIYTVSGGTRVMTLGFYNDNAGAPDSLVADTAEVACVAGGFTVAACGGSIVNGNSYWIAGNQGEAGGSTSQDYKYDADASYKLLYKGSVYSAGTLPDPHPGTPFELGSSKYSAYLTYTPTGAAAGGIVPYRRTLRFFKGR